MSVKCSYVRAQFRAGTPYFHNYYNIFLLCIPTNSFFVIFIFIVKSCDVLGSSRAGPRAFLLRALPHLRRGVLVFYIIRLLCY